MKGVKILKKAQQRRGFPDVRARQGYWVVFWAKLLRHRPRDCVMIDENLLVTYRAPACLIFAQSKPAHLPGPSCCESHVFRAPARSKLMRCFEMCA